VTRGLVPALVLPLLLLAVAGAWAQLREWVRQGAEAGRRDVDEPQAGD
jgi:hypothetical protein